MQKKTVGTGIVAMGIALALPLVIQAQVVATGSPGINDWIDIIRRILSWAFPAIITVAIFFLLYNVVQFIVKKGDDPKAAQALMKKIGVSIIALVAVLAIWGIMAFISSTLGLGIGGKINENFIPGVEGFDQFP